MNSIKVLLVCVTACLFTPAINARPIFCPNSKTTFTKVKKYPFEVFENRKKTIQLINLKDEIRASFFDTNLNQYEARYSKNDAKQSNEGPGYVTSHNLIKKDLKTTTGKITYVKGNENIKNEIESIINEFQIQRTRLEAKKYVENFFEDPKNFKL